MDVFCILIHLIYEYYKKMSNIDSLNTEKFLFLDVGNSAVKAVYRQKGKWTSVHHKGKGHATDLIEWIKSHIRDFEAIVMSSVRKEIGNAFEEELQEVECITLSVGDIPDEMLDYATPETLGIDRFLACYGAVALTSKSAVVIDAGTACTIDFISADEVFRGGVIAPGFSAFNALLSKRAPVLPFIESDTLIPEVWPGKSTIASLAWGQAGFYRDAIMAALKRYEEEYDSFDVFITGGDARKIESLLGMQGRIRPFLVFKGMERMMQLSTSVNGD